MFIVIIAQIIQVSLKIVSNLLTYYNLYNQDLYHLNLRRQPMISIVSVREKCVNWTGSMSDQNCVLAALPESLECHAFTSCT